MTKFKGCNKRKGFPREYAKFQKGEDVEKGVSNIMGDETSLPTCINYCKIYCYCKIFLELPKYKPPDGCNILDKLD